jgi:hypothetical protein
MQIAVISANMEGFDRPVEYAAQSVDYDSYLFTNENFPLRFCAMTPRLQARIPKMFGWQMAPGYDFYIWVDCSYSLLHQDSVKWLIEQCTGFDVVVFRHPRRTTIQQEADYIKWRLAKNCTYIVPRYQNELIDEQMAEIKKDEEFVDENLYQSSTLVYKNNDKVKDMMKEWWYHTSRFHIVDQLALPYVLYKSDCTVRAISVPMKTDVIRTPYLTQVRYR